MNNLEIINFNGKKVIDSRIIAERIDMQHKNLLQKIKGYEDILTSSKFSPLKFFIKNNYQDAKGETRLCYLLTKQGCEMVANKLTGEKGVLFTAEYVQAFNAMEEQTKQTLPTSPMELLELQFQALKEVNAKADQNTKDIEYLKDDTRLDTGQYNHLGRLIASRVNEIKETRKLKLNKKQNGLLYQGINHEIKEITGVGTRSDLRQRHYVQVCSFINSWEPSSATMERIKALEVNNEEI